MFMIGEYVHMFALAWFTAVFFLGGWQVFPFVSMESWPLWLAAIVGFIALNVKMAIFVFIMMWFRGTLPRFRIDHLQDFAWKFLVPTTIVLLIAVAIVVRLWAYLDPGFVRTIGESITLLIINVVVGGVALFMVTRAARRSRSRGLRAVTAVEGAPAPASK